MLARHGYGLDKDATDPAVLDALRQELTVSPKVNPNVAFGGGTVPEYPVYRESARRLYVPRAFGLRRFGPPTQDRLGDGMAAPGLTFEGRLRPAQQEAVDAFLAAARDPTRRGGLIVVGCGGGKTVMAIHLACRLGRKTLIVAHKSFLLEQWRERLAEYAPQASVGTVKQDKVDVAGRDVVLASLQSLAMRDYPPDLLEGVGFVVVDECHHIAAEVFSRALPKITAGVTLGLSATPDRNDGLSCVFEWFLGPPCFVGERRSDAQVVVRLLDYVHTNSLEPGDAAYGTIHHIGFGARPPLNTARMVNELAACPSRNAFVVAALLEAMAAHPERRALVLSERRAQLLDVERRLRAGGVKSIGFYVGGRKQKDLDVAATQSVLLGTFAMAAEGMDIPDLGILLLASPTGNVEQAVGRVRRRAGVTALVLDVKDAYGHFAGLARRRAKFYKDERFEIKKKE